jgi:hypothetical protein
MAQDLTVNIKTTSDVPQAMDKAKAATVSFDKQVQDISRKFSTAFKDFAFAFLAPMVIFNNVLSMIQEDIARAKQDAKEGFDLIAKGDTAYASSMQKRQASYVQYKIAQQEEEQKVKAGAQKIYEEFLNTKEGKGIYDKYATMFSGPEGEANAFTIPEMASSKKVRAEIEDWFKNNQDFNNFSKPSETPRSDYSAPQGINAVVGMGNNAAMDAMNAQLEENRKQTALLQQIAQGGGNVPADFTKGNPHEDGYGDQM